MSARKSVFISSTSKDLTKHRQQARDACLAVGMFPIMMESLAASDANAISASLKMADEADIYVGILAYRYGYVPDGHDISITQMEYERAVERDIPRLVFIMDSSHPIVAENMETGDGAEKVKALKEHIMKTAIVNFFTSPEDLRAKVIHSLNEQNKA